MKRIMVFHSIGVISALTLSLLSLFSTCLVAAQPKVVGPFKTYGSMTLTPANDPLPQFLNFPSMTHSQVYSYNEVSFESGKTYVKEANLIIYADVVRFASGAQLVVGTSLISIHAKRIISDGGQIVSFDDHTASQPNAQNGVHSGQHGSNGADGQSAGAVMIRVSEALELVGSGRPLIVSMHGQNGGNGGNGYAGGAGAQGAPGRHATVRSIHVVNGNTIEKYCNPYPSPGGHGHPGGAGGNGGNGGRGGAGGLVSVRLAEQFHQFISITAQGGKGGKGGAGAPGGPGGPGGHGGGGMNVCRDAPAGPVGPPGTHGAGGREGSYGPSGRTSLAP